MLTRGLSLKLVVRGRCGPQAEQAFCVAITGEIQGAVRTDNHADRARQSLPVSSLEAVHDIYHIGRFAP